MECKHRCVNVRRVSDIRRAFWPAIGVTEISDDWYRSIKGVIVISLGIPQSARENIGCTWEHLGGLATSLGPPPTSLGTPMTGLGALTTSLGAPATSLGAPRITVEQSGPNNIIVGNAGGTPGYHSYYLSFNDRLNSCIQFVFSSMYLCIYVSMYLNSYPSTHGISGLAAGGA